MTNDEINELGREVFEKHCGRPHPYEGLQPWVIELVRAALTVESAEQKLPINIKRQLFRFESKQHWVNKAQSWYANCGVHKGHYITVDAGGHVMHMGRCFQNASYPVTCYELQTNWPAAEIS